MHELFAELRAGLAPTLLLVTRDLAEAAIADGVDVLVGGRLHQVAEPGELYRHPAAGPRIRGRVTGSGHIGVRQIAIIETGAGGRIEVELPPRKEARWGAEVVVHPTPEASVWLVSGADS